jgi:hypothetical protein
MSPWRFAILSDWESARSIDDYCSAGSIAEDKPMHWVGPARIADHGPQTARSE